MVIFQAVVIGSGPAGCTAAIYLARMGCTVILITGYQVGGQLVNATLVENWPGEQCISGAKLMDRILHHVKQLNVQVKTDKVFRLELQAKPLVVVAKDIYVCNIVVAATGSTPKQLSLNCRFHGSGLSFCVVCDGMFYTQLHVCVCGGGEAAVSGALYLKTVCSKVTLMCRRFDLIAAWLDQQLVFLNEELGLAQMQFGLYFICWLGNRTTLYGKCSSIRCSAHCCYTLVFGLFCLIGHTPNSNLMLQYATTDQGGYVRKSRKSYTTQLLVAGDVKDGTYQQAVTSSASGCIAALKAQKLLSSNSQ